MNRSVSSRCTTQRSAFKFPSRVTAALALAGMLCAPLVHAQGAGGSGSASGDRSSWLPYTSSGYVGVNGGISDYGGDCVLVFGCDDTERAFKIYTGGMINQWLGAEVGYLHMGTVDRNGGNTRAHGLNASLVGSLPLSEQFKVYGKVGVTYGRTRTTAVSAPAGNETGWGPSFGFGAGLNITPQWTLVLDWDRHRFDFAGGRDHVSATTAGVRFNF